MLNKLNTRYILQLVIVIISLFIATLTLGDTSLIVAIDSSVEEKTTQYLGSTFNDDKINFLYFSKEDYNAIVDSGVPFNSYLTNLINNNLARAKSVVIDFVLEESGDDDVDNALGLALNTTAASVISYNDESISKDSAVPPQVFYKNSAYQGFRNYATNELGYAVNYYPLSPTNSNAISLIVAVAQSNGVQVSKNTKYNMLSIVTQNSSEIISLNDDLSFKRIPIEFNSRNTYSALKVLQGEYQSYIFDDSTVFIGFSNDLVQTPYGEIPHSEYIANGYVSLLTNNTFKIASSFLTFLFGVFLLILLFISETSPRWWVRLLLLFSIIFSAYFINFLFAKYLHIYFNLTIEIMFLLIVAILSSFSSFITVREELVRDNSVVQEIMLLNNIKIQESTFSTYLLSIAPSILQKSGIEIVRPEIFAGAPILNKLFTSSDLNTEDVVFKRGYILIPLQSYKKNNTKNRYTLLRSKVLVSDSSVKNIIAFILSIDLHFKHIIETERENKLLYSAIEGIVLSLNARDTITGEHSRRVATFSVKIGGWLGYSEEELEKLHFASLIHDIGKIGISDSILAKPSFFSNSDFEIMKSHPELGVQVMGGFLEDKDITAAILQHHERPDGKGYPFGLTGDQIRPIAKIIKIADVYDALVSSRHYKDPWPIEKVCDTFYLGKGTEFDEELIELVLEKIKPDDWLPPVAIDDEPQIYFSDAIRAIAIDIYKNAMYSTRTLKSTSIEHDIVDFANIQSVFDVLLGESILNGFLYKEPTQVYSDPTNQITYFAKLNNGNFKKGVLIFLRNFYTGGAFISGLGEEKENFTKEIKDALGPVLFSDKSLSAWSNKKGTEFYILFESKSPELENVLVYFNSYVVYANDTH